MSGSADSVDILYGRFSSALKNSINGFNIKLNDEYWWELPEFIPTPKRLGLRCYFRDLRLDLFEPEEVGFSGCEYWAVRCERLPEEWLADVSGQKVKVYDDGVRELLALLNSADTVGVEIKLQQPEHIDLRGQRYIWKSQIHVGRADISSDLYVDATAAAAVMQLAEGAPGYWRLHNNKREADIPWTPADKKGCKAVCVYYDADGKQQGYVEVVGSLQARSNLQPL